MLVYLMDMRKRREDLFPFAYDLIDKNSEDVKGKTDEEIFEYVMDRYILAKVCARESIEDTTIRKDELNRIYINSRIEGRRIYLDFAHSGRYYALAFAEDTAAIDMKKIPNVQDSFIDEVCSEQENKEVRVYKNANDNSYKVECMKFFTRKESFLKIMGKDENTDYRSIDTSKDMIFVDGKRYCFDQFTYRGGYICSACERYEGKYPQLIIDRVMEI